MIILVKKHKIHESGAESQTSENYTDLDAALKKFYQYSSNYIADTTIERFDITLLDTNLVPIKTEHYARVYPEVETAIE